MKSGVGGDRRCRHPNGTLRKTVEIKTTQRKQTEVVYSELVIAREMVIVTYVNRDSKTDRGVEKLNS